MTYRKISQAFWEGDLAARLRGDADALAIAFYVMTCPAANAIGCYRLSLATIVDDTGIPEARTRQALKKLNRSPGEDRDGEAMAGFLDFDETYRMMFVGEFARHEWGEVPNPKENRTRGLPKMLSGFSAVGRKSFVWAAFQDRYADPWADVFEAMTEPFERLWTPPGRVRTTTEGVSTTSDDSSRARQDQEEDQEEDQDPEQEEKSVGDRSDLATDMGAKDPLSKKGPSRAEISWRIADTWVHFLERRARYYRLAKGIEPPGRPPAMAPLIKEDIRKSLLVHDAELLGAEHREAWQRDSITRAAGGGMYLTPYNLGKREENDADGNGKRATTYLEAWRPWRIRKGRDPAGEYAETYFEKRALAEAAEGKKT